MDIKTLRIKNTDQRIWKERSWKDYWKRPKGQEWS